MWPRLPNLQCQPGKTYLAAVHVSSQREGEVKTKTLLNTHR